jgi:hypothetical protein
MHCAIVKSLVSNMVVCSFFMRALKSPSIMSPMLENFGYLVLQEVQTLNRQVGSSKSKYTNFPLDLYKKIMIIYILIYHTHSITKFLVVQCCHSSRGCSGSMCVWLWLTSDSYLYL